MSLVYMFVHSGIDVDIDVEHDGQRTKVTPPSKDDGVVGVASTDKGGASSNKGGANIETDGASSEVGEASAAGGATEGSKVSKICINTDY